MEKIYYLTESEYQQLNQRIDEIVPLIAAALPHVARFAVKKLAPKVLGKVAGKAMGGVAKGGLQSIIKMLGGKAPQLANLLQGQAGQVLAQNPSMMQQVMQMVQGGGNIGAVTDLIQGLVGGGNNGAGAANGAGAVAPQKLNIPQLNV